MKQPVELSRWCKILSCATIVILIAATCAGFYLTGNEAYSRAGLTLMIATAFLIMWYTPLYVTLDNGTLVVSRLLRELKIPAGEIAAVEPATYTQGKKVICGSRGFFGHWGWYSQPDTGKYFSYHGKTSDTFLVTLHDGRRYLLGCREGAAMAEALRTESAACQS